MAAILLVLLSVFALLVPVASLVEPQGDERVDQLLPRDPCRLRRCPSRSQCHVVDEVASCRCKPGFYGADCLLRRFWPAERISRDDRPRRQVSRDPCRNFRCMNGGQCLAPADLPRCQCQPGYTGLRCERRVGGDPCNGCPLGSTCRPTNLVCTRAPCPTHTCRPVLTLDRCGGCPSGQTCRTFYPMCPPPPRCDLLRELRSTRSTGRLCPLPDSYCQPSHVCVGGGRGGRGGGGVRDMFA